MTLIRPLFHCRRGGLIRGGFDCTMKLKLNYAVIWIKMKMFPPLSMCGPNMANLSCVGMEKMY
jgi:hypothetical protein